LYIYGLKLGVTELSDLRKYVNFATEQFGIAEIIREKRVTTLYTSV